MSRNHARRFPFFLLVLVVSVVAGCGSDSPTGPRFNNGQFTDDIDSGGDFEEVTPHTTAVETKSDPEQQEDGSFWVCTETTYDFLGAPPEYASFNPNDNIVYPGHLLQGRSLASDSPDLVGVKRAGGTISIDLLNGSSGVRAEVEEVSRSRIREAANKILDANNGVVPARFSVDTYKVQSKEEMAARLGVNVETFTTSFNARMSFSQRTDMHRVVVVLNQTFYTMDFDDPTSSAEVFAPGVTPEDLDPYIGPGNPAAYISSVAYGRRFYILVESTESEKEIEAAVRASYNAAAVGGSIEADARYVSELKEVRIKVHAMGGDQSLALATFNGDFGAVRRFLTEGADYRTGVPLVYTLRALKDKRSVAVKVATRYTVKDCVPIEESIENPIVWFDSSYGLSLKRSTVGTTTTDFVRGWGSKFPSPAIDGSPTGNEICGWLGEITVNRVEPAIHFSKRNYSAGLSSGQIKYDGRGFENTDYTVFVVTIPNSQVRYFAWGASDRPNERLAIGFTGEGTVTMSHGPGQTLEAPLINPNEWRVYTFRFSQTEGMAIYENDQLIGADPSLTQPLTLYPEAQIGAAGEDFRPPDGVSALISQFKAYGSAVTEAERRAQVINWINRFNRSGDAKDPSGRRVPRRAGGAGGMGLPRRLVRLKFFREDQRFPPMNPEDANVFPWATGPSQRRTMLPVLLLPVGSSIRYQ